MINYLSDIFDTLKQRVFLQGPNDSIACFASTLQVSVRKLDLYTINKEAKQYRMFLHLSSL